VRCKAELLTLSLTVSHKTEKNMVKETPYNTQFGVFAGGQVCNMIRHTDEAVVSNTQDGLQQLADYLNRVIQDYGMKNYTVKRQKVCAYAVRKTVDWKLKLTDIDS